MTLRELLSRLDVTLDPRHWEAGLYVGKSYVYLSPGPLVIVTWRRHRIHHPDGSTCTHREAR